MGNYAFIDSQNLNLGVQSLGWKLNQKNYISRIDLLRNSLELKKTGIRGRSKP